MCKAEVFRYVFGFNIVTKGFPGPINSKYMSVIMVVTWPLSREKEKQKSPDFKEEICRVVKPLFAEVKVFGI